MAEILLVQALANRYETSEPYPAKLRVRSLVLLEKMVITVADLLVSIGGVESSPPPSAEEEKREMQQKLRKTKKLEDTTPLITQ
ncbi:unnamed protein product [Ilex paraguariensis]|uniref:Uncharacterized protein n=1 Tax=Ilex paraguariensis TaxID=185542 RepID=A0ABC8UF11_9AQUA